MMNLSDLMPKGGMGEMQTPPPIAQAPAVETSPAPTPVTQPLPDPGLLMLEIQAISQGMKFRAAYGAGVTPQMAKQHLLSLDPDTQFENEFFKRGGRNRETETGDAITATLEKTRDGKLFLSVTFQNDETSGVAKGRYEIEELQKVVASIPILAPQFLPVIEGGSKNVVVILAGIAKVKYYKGKEAGDLWIDSLEEIPQNGGQK